MVARAKRGSVEPLRKVDLKSKVAGQVSEVLVDVGSRVKAGDVLARLDPRDARRELSLAASRNGVNRALLNQASTQLQIKQKAHAQGALSALELATADGEVKRLQALMQVDQSEQAILRDRISCTELKSPIDGVVLARSIQPGEMVTPGVAAMFDGRPLLVVAQVEQLLVRAELNQIDVARPGTPPFASGTAVPKKGRPVPGPRPCLPSPGTRLPSSGRDRPSAGRHLPESGTCLPESGTCLPESGTGLPESGTGLPESEIRELLQSQIVGIRTLIKTQGAPPVEPAGAERPKGSVMSVAMMR